jgi:hypothetical protein
VEKLGWRVEGGWQTAHDSRRTAKDRGKRFKILRYRVEGERPKVKDIA